MWKGTVRELKQRQHSRRRSSATALKLSREQLEPLLGAKVQGAAAHAVHVQSARWRGTLRSVISVERPVPLWPVLQTATAHDDLLLLLR